jgi:ankyrin repeat protein
MSALDRSCSADFVVKLLEHGADPAARRLDGGSALHAAAFMGNAPALEVIMQAVLSSASKAGNDGAAVLRDLVAAGVGGATTALDLAQMQGHSEAAAVLLKYA